MLSCAEQVQIQKYKTPAYKTTKTAGVQIIMLKNQLSIKKRIPTKPKYRISVHKITPNVQTNDDRQTHTHTLAILIQEDRAGRRSENRHYSAM